MSADVPGRVYRASRSISCTCMHCQKLRFDTCQTLNRRRTSRSTLVCREAIAAAPGAPGHVLSYMHALEIMQQYSQVLAAAQELLLTTRSLRCQIAMLHQSMFAM